MYFLPIHDLHFLTQQRLIRPDHAYPSAYTYIFVATINFNHVHDFFVSFLLQPSLSVDYFNLFACTRLGRQKKNLS